jgi:hypothetical protein
VTETAVQETREYLEEEHGEADARSAGLVREDYPELDEALDPEFEPVFELNADPDLENRDLHEADEELEAEDGGDDAGAKIAPRSQRTIPGMGGKVYDYRGTGLCPPQRPADEATLHGSSHPRRPEYDRDARLREAR